ncbi:MAG: nicotinate (nicotinamide) nucleotide adenylyltransferase [Alistipes sp.]|nr:nicotinate (nicotinamide) nucleotide adenylyltransferase [Alistipes sp.]MBR0339436.1 nicotinate (nicotinamide) nucleotide adenylyltransferase [Alistipes sp.]
MKRVALYFGSFNPIHKGHIALAEWVVEQGLCDELIFIVSPQNPLKSSTELAPEFSRYEMCEMACASSRYPDRIKVSAVEFVLEKPSYTINTLRYLRSEFGSQMQFSILLGADNIESFDRWREYEEILRDYRLLVYPREGYSVEKFAEKITFLSDAPLFDFAATDIRKAIANDEDFTDKVPSAVAKYIIQNRLYK